MAGSRAGAGWRGLATSLVTSVLLAVPGGARAQDGNTLQRYRPTLAFDRDERHLPAAVDGRRHKGLPEAQLWQVVFLIAPLAVIALAVVVRRRSSRRAGS